MAVLNGDVFAGGVWERILPANVTAHRYSSHGWVSAWWTTTTVQIAETVQQSDV